MYTYRTSFSKDILLDLRIGALSDLYKKFLIDYKDLIKYKILEASPMDENLRDTLGFVMK